MNTSFIKYTWEAIQGIIKDFNSKSLLVKQEQYKEIIKLLYKSFDFKKFTTIKSIEWDKKKKEIYIVEEMPPF